MKKLFILLFACLGHGLLAQGGPCAADLIADMLGDPDFTGFMQTGNKKDKYAAWFELAKAGENVGKTNPTTIQKVADNIIGVKKTGGYGNWKQAETTSGTWPEEWQNELKDDLSDTDLGDKIRDATGGGDDYSENMERSYETLEWLKDKKFGGNENSMHSALEAIGPPGQLSSHRFVTMMKSETPPISISLGRSGGLAERAQSLNSTSFYHFYKRGFTSTTKILDAGSTQAEWMAEVATSLKKSYDRGGDFYVHMDNIDDYSGLHDPTSESWTFGIFAEIKYLSNHGLVDTSRVKFRLGDGPLPDESLASLLEALEVRKVQQQNGVGHAKTWVGFEGITFN